MAHYRVEVMGEIGAGFGDAFRVVDVEPRGATTVLTVDLQDQAALHGLFGMLEGIGVALVAVNPAGRSGP